MEYGPSSCHHRRRIRRAVRRQGARPADVDITLLDRRNFHLFQPFLYQVATGELRPPTSLSLCERFSVNSAIPVSCWPKLTDIDPDRRVVVLQRTAVIPYDSLIVATGAKNHYFGNDHWAEFAPGLKSLEDATRIRHRILYAFEAAEKETGSRKAPGLADLRCRRRRTHRRGIGGRSGRNCERHSRGRFPIHPPGGISNSVAGWIAACADRRLLRNFRRRRKNR